jgi:uncharacterized membrane protein
MEQCRRDCIGLQLMKREARVRLITTALISASMIASPVLAAATPASKLSVASASRSGAKGGDSDLASGSGGILALALVAGIAAILVVGELASDNDSPDSP